jgi:hypothetical protein
VAPRAARGYTPVMLLRLVLLALPLSAAEPGPGVQRLAHGSWEFKQDEPGKTPKLLTLPGTQRVVVLPGKPPKGWVWIGTWSEGKAATGLVEAAAFGAGDASRPEDERLAFASDVEAAVKLAAGLDRGYAPDFTAYRSKLRAKAVCLAPALKAGTGWEKFKKLDAAGLAVNLSDKPETLRRLKAFVFVGFDPKAPTGRTLSEETLVVPLSAQWFRTRAPLNDYYKREFANGKWDARIVGGGSGEGISGDTMLDYQKRLLALRDFAKGLGDKSVEAAPEYAWLMGLSEQAFKVYKRMIFIHEYSWDYVPGQGWADFIAVDQSFGPVQGHPLYSILIHEINVNSGSPQFLPADTHLPASDSKASWERVAKEGPAFLAEPAEAAKFLALNPLMSAVALGYHLDALARASGACR